MAPNKDLPLRLCTFNCRSLKNSFSEVKQLCDMHDVIFLQEHWLMPFELHMLSDVHSDFLAHGVSAVSIDKDIVSGRPYGGTAILYRKHIAKMVNVVKNTEPRLSAVSIDTSCGPVLFVCVYMPYDNNDVSSLIEYVDICSKISTLFADSDAVYLVVAGDFNCSVNSRLSDAYCDFLKEENLVCVDTHMLLDAVTFISDDGQRMSWIDHIICSPALLPSIDDVCVLYGNVSSDHRPLSACFNSILSPCDIDTSYGVRQTAFYSNWAKASDHDIINYAGNLRLALKAIDIPCHILSCKGVCDNSYHYELIDKYYNDIIDCVYAASDINIPKVKSNYSPYNVPGWSDYVQDKHETARQAFLEWMCDGKPRCGWSYENMYKTKSVFKHALRYCKRIELQMKADACANSLKDTDPRKFWKAVGRASCKKATSHANKIADCVGDVNICNMWFDHFKSLYNSVDDSASRTKFNNLCQPLISQYSDITISLNDVLDAVRVQKKAKCAGPNGLAMESFIYGCTELWVHLSLLFTCCIRHCFLPVKFMAVSVTPLVKNKGADLTDRNNYRAIAVSNVETKIFERIILSIITVYDTHDKFQFGFKRGHSTTLCTGSVKKTIDYYVSRGSHVFACFVDFHKAFDCVNYWKLFAQLLEDGINAKLVKLLAFWYSKQEVTVVWNNVQSNSFTVGNGTKQGGVLSPYLFTRYIRDLLCAVASSRFGCRVGNMSANIFAYADDIVLLAPSWHALQLLIYIVEKFCTLLDIMCNTKKTVCMIFSPKDTHKIISHCFPAFTMSGSLLQFVDEFKYLGHCITDTLKDDDDIKREIRNMYIRTNMLIRRFGNCSLNVKLRLFRSYCICLYGVALWSTYSASTLQQFKYCYHKCIKMFFGYDKYHSVTAVLLETRLPSFDTVMSNYRYSFSTQCDVCANAMVSYFRSILVDFFCYLH